MPNSLQAMSSPETAIDWSDVLADHAHWLRAVIRARVGNGDAVDDVMQELAIAMVQSQGPADREKLAPWLYRIAIRKALQYRRRVGRQRKLTAQVAERMDEAVEADPLDWLLGQERRELIRRALSQLPARDREILLLKHGEGWSYRKIAEHLGATRHTIEYRLMRARRRMRTLLTRGQEIEVMR